MNQKYTLDEMIDALHKPNKQRKSLSELDSVIDDIIARNPEWLEQITSIIEADKDET